MQDSSPRRRRLLGLGGASAALLAAPWVLPPRSAHSQPQPGADLHWPTRPLRIVVGFGGGSSPDMVARTIAEPLAQALGQPVIVDNRPGASGNIAASMVAKATDQHTIGMLINGNMTIAKVLQPSIPYDPQKDLAPVSLICTAPMVLTVPATGPVKDGRSFLA
ncbi:MAG: tripartite tricarboxylate transporter substrate-binding protein, partial [Bordetella sp.]|nr:tripartite tricarboxylate transporter substrate-binding protein [Bordetella sp.]